MSYIDVKNISMHFGSTVALNNVNISLDKNKIYGLLGRNGAGKSTLLNLMTNKLFPTNGKILMNGEPVQENDSILSRIYCMSEKTMYPESMKVNAAYQWTKKFYPSFDMEYAMRLSKKFELNTKKAIKNLSTGYTSIFKIVIALSCNAETILLDEPILGLDAFHRDLFYRELLTNFRNNPSTIVISTHLIEEAADIIEEVIILKEGEVLLQQTVEDVLSKGYTVSGPAGKVDAYVAGKQAIGSDSMGGLKSTYMFDKAPEGPLPEGLEISKLDLQKMFIHLTNS
ncbi:MAG: ABC transporter ATP-binding protein [Clostridiales bacterium]|nr:ABC transporter ATP-binding protein [Clostridiales bacterium]